MGSLPPSLSGSLSGFSIVLLIQSLDLSLSVRSISIDHSLFTRLIFLFPEFLQRHFSNRIPNHISRDFSRTIQQNRPKFSRPFLALVIQNRLL